MIGVILENAQGEIVFANDEALRLLGIKQEDQKAFRTLCEALPGSAGGWIPCSIGCGSSTLEALVIPLARGGEFFGRAILLRESRSVSHKEWNLAAAILDAIPDCVYAKDKDHRFLFANRATVRHLGLSTREELLGKTDFDLKPRELAQRHWNEEEEFLCAGREILTRAREVDDLTGKAWVATIKILLRNDQGEVIGLVGVDRDITEQKLAEEALQESEHEKSLILNALGEQVTYLDRDFRIIWVNAAVLHNFGRPPEYFIGKRCFEVIEGRDTPCPGCAVAKTFESGKPETGEVISRNGVIWLQKAYPIFDEEGRVTRVVEISRNVTEEKRAIERIQYLTFHDPLTGCYNRLFFLEELKRLDTPRQLPLSIIMADVNNLKLVNDAFGHRKGDELLQKVAGILSSSCRTEDLVVRWGGDEFLVLLPRTPATVAQDIMERIRKRCAEESQKDERPIRISVALGCATKEKDEDLLQVINEAEVQMYRDKFADARIVRHLTLLSLEQSLREIPGEIETHCQRLRILARKMGVALGLSQKDLEALDLLARLHDLGKLGISRDLLAKPGPLTDAEWEEVRRHPEIGYRMAQVFPELAPVAEGILAHHERFDGTGYPQGLKGEEIPLLARIIAIVDTFDTMTSDRPHRKALTKKEALEYIRENAGTQFDPDLVALFLSILEEPKSPSS